MGQTFNASNTSTAIAKTSPNLLRDNSPKDTGTGGVAVVRMLQEFFWSNNAFKYMHSKKRSFGAKRFVARDVSPLL